MGFLQGILIYHFSINAIITILYLSYDIHNIIRTAIRNKGRKVKYKNNFSNLDESISKIIVFLLFGNFIIIYKHFE